jgi:hypothetical protein
MELSTIKVSIKHLVKDNGFCCIDVISSNKYTYGCDIVEAWQKAQPEYLLRGELRPCEWKLI